MQLAIKKREHCWNIIKRNISHFLYRKLIPFHKRYCEIKIKFRCINISIFPFYLVCFHSSHIKSSYWISNEIHKNTNTERFTVYHLHFKINFCVCIKFHWTLLFVLGEIWIRFSFDLSRIAMIWCVNFFLIYFFPQNFKYIYCSLLLQWKWKNEKIHNSCKKIHIRNIFLILFNKKFDSNQIFIRVAWIRVGV